MSNAYYPTGSTETTQHQSDVTIGGGNAVTFHPGFGGTCEPSGTVASNGCRIGFVEELPAGFQGSVVVAAEEAVVAFANVNNNASGSVGVSGGKARSAYQGTGGAIASDTLYFPTVKYNFANQSTIFFVQAAGENANVTINYTMENGASFSENKVIEANKMYAFVPAAAGVTSCNGGTGSNCIGGATVTAADGKLIAGTVVEYREGVSVSEFVLATRAQTPSDIGSKIIAPTMKNEFFGGTTGASILNTSNSEVVVDLSFSVTNVTSGCSASIGDTATDQVTIPGNGSTVVSRFRGNVGGLPDCVFYAMTATAQNPAQNLAVTVNEAQTNSGQSLKAVYSGFNAATAQPSTLFPLVKENFVNNTTGLTIVNSGSVATQVDVTYVGTNSTHVLRTIEIGPGEAVPLRQTYNGASNPNYSPISGGYPVQGDKYSVTAEAVTEGATIIGLAQEATLSGALLDIYNYEGFSQ
jgi:hypothetical protein